MMPVRYLLLLPLFSCLFSFSLQAQEKAVPKKGEGIVLFLKRHNRAGPDYQKEFIRLNQGRFGKGNTLLLGVRYTLPPLRASGNKTGQSGYEPLFGKALAAYKVTSSELEGACFYLVSGHGGPDPGAIGRIGSAELHEDEYAYDIVLRLARNLMTRGARVHIIIQDAKDGIRNEQYLKNGKQETCMGKAIPYNQVQRLQQRCEKINLLYMQDKDSYKRAIFIHVDSRSKSRRTDVFFYHQNQSAASKRLARTMRSTFHHKYKKSQPGRGFSGTVKGRNLYVLKNTKPASVFVELGNIQNSFDQQRIILSENRQALANWLCEGFVTDYNRHKGK